ncbi:MAG: VPLPA-CTERM sorting domain-containing protein [Gammaproteobacteria bacterium]
MSAAVAFAPASSAALATYSTDFESAPSGGTGFTPIGDGWLTFVNQFNTDGSYAGGYQYNGGLAPSDGPQVSAINTSEAGPNQGAQVLSVYSDYDNRAFQENGNPAAVETLVFQEQLLDGSESGLWYFGFDAKAGGITGTATAEAFIKVLDAGFQPVANGLIQLSTTSISANWSRYEAIVDFDAVGGGAVRTQFGFQTLTGNDVPSDNFYDNVTWQQTSSVNPVPVPAAVWLFGSGLVGLVGVARRRKSKS